MALRIAIPTTEDFSEIRNYIETLRLAGAEPVPGAEIDPETCDGLLLPGGGDMNAALFGQAHHPMAEKPNDALDALQLEMFHRFTGLGKPVLGICRGHQVINVALGGTLIQHLPTAADHVHDGPGIDHVHVADAEADSFIGKLYGTHFAVNSSHHQGVGLPGKGLRAVMHTADGVVEAMEHESLPIWSVQFHPERMCFTRKREDTVDGSLLFRFFLEKCGQAAAQR